MEYLVATNELPIRKACAAIGLSRSGWYRPLVDCLERDRTIAEALVPWSMTSPDSGSGSCIGGCGGGVANGFTNGFIACIAC